jgi:hypothetical protein
MEEILKVIGEASLLRHEERWILMLGTHVVVVLVVLVFIVIVLGTAVCVDTRLRSNLRARCASSFFLLLHERRSLVAVHLRGG